METALLWLCSQYTLQWFAGTTWLHTCWKRANAFKSVSAGYRSVPGERYLVAMYWAMALLSVCGLARRARGYCASSIRRLGIALTKNLHTSLGILENRDLAKWMQLVKVCLRLLFAFAQINRNELGLQTLLQGNGAHPIGASREGGIRAA